MSDWVDGRLADSIAALDAGVSVNAEDRPHGAGEIGVLKTSAVSGGMFFPEQNKTVVERERRLVSEPVLGDSILVSRMNTPALVGESCYVRDPHPSLFLPDRLWQLKPKDRSIINMRWLSFMLQSAAYRRHVEVHATGTSGSMKNLPKSKLFALPVSYPALAEQIKIARILDTLDTAIHETEAIIAKLRAVKQGLLHDLLTRGIDANGELRPPQIDATHLYKESQLGWIPQGWEIFQLNDLAESLVDGPFGSNLKTAHYVENPGVRVIRLQNILPDEFDDSQQAFISERHAMLLSRNRVVGGDVLIASLGDANYPVGRSCCYPAELPDAVNKADCFRFRANTRCRNEFVMFSMNGAAARKQVRGYEQGVTMKRINLGNLRRIEIALPSISEQDLIVERLQVAQRQIEVAALEHKKLCNKKTGLMDDLLTGRVRVTPLLAEA